MKLTLSRLESLLLSVCDDVRGELASERLVEGNIESMSVDVAFV